MLPEIVSSPLALILWRCWPIWLGSIPFGLVITRAMGLGDMRADRVGQHRGDQCAAHRQQGGGGGDACAGRRQGRGGGAGRARPAGRGCGAAGGAAAFLGHLYPVWLGFKGGKGVATYLGTLLALFWPAGVAACAMWLAAAAVARISSLAALVAAAGSIPALALLGAPQAVALGAVLTALIFWRHRSNIARIRAGTEPRIGRKKD
jgi:acyl phosphate:glycerol-3-phosphate acyltransferase